MRRQALVTTAWAVSLFASLAASPIQAADLIWEVENPFRFFKPTRSFALHEAAYNTVRGDPASPMPADIIWRTERRLNDPDCKDASHPERAQILLGQREGRLRPPRRSHGRHPHRPSGARGPERRLRLELAAA
jgi:hypothetical protein